MGSIWADSFRGDRGCFDRRCYWWFNWCSFPFYGLVFVIDLFYYYSTAFGRCDWVYRSDCVTGAQLVATGAVAAGIGISMFAKQSKRSGKEMSSDKPSWVNSNMVDHNKSAQQNATDILNEKYGVGNWESGPKSEYNKIVKWIIRKIFFGG